MTALRPLQRKLSLILIATTLSMPAWALDEGKFYTDSSDDAEAWREIETVLPPFPTAENWVEFPTTAVATNRFFISTQGLVAGSDGIMRYALKVLSRGGATSISYEGIRCAEWQVRTYATGDINNQNWRKIDNAPWRPVLANQLNRHHRIILEDFVCPNGRPAYSIDIILSNIKRGPKFGG